MIYDYSSIHESVRDEQGTENDCFVSFDSHHFSKYTGSSLGRERKGRPTPCRSFYFWQECKIVAVSRTAPGRAQTARSGFSNLDVFQI
jgi:hypothetical protein